MPLLICHSAKVTFVPNATSAAKSNAAKTGNVSVIMNVYSCVAVPSGEANLKTYSPTSVNVNVSLYSLVFS